MCRPPRIPPYAWADENTSPTRKRGVGIIPRLRVGLVLTPLIQLLAAISSGHPMPLHSSTPILPYSNPQENGGMTERAGSDVCLYRTCAWIQPSSTWIELKVKP